MKFTRARTTCHHLFIFRLNNCTVNKSRGLNKWLLNGFFWPFFKSVPNFHFCSLPMTYQGFPGGSDGKEPPFNAEDPGLIPGWGRSPGEVNGKPLQFSCLENPMDRGAWWVHAVAKSWTWLINQCVCDTSHKLAETYYPTTFAGSRIGAADSAISRDPVIKELTHTCVHTPHTPEHM